MVAVGLTLVEPLADEELKVPGEIETVEAPLVAQLSVLLDPELMVPGLETNEEMDGEEPFPLLVFDELVPSPPHPARPAQARRISAATAELSKEVTRPHKPNFLLPKELQESMPEPSRRWFVQV